MGFLRVKAKLFEMIISVQGLDRASYTKKNDVKDTFLGLQAHTKKQLFLEAPYWYPGRVSPQN